MKIKIANAAALIAAVGLGATLIAIANSAQAPQKSGGLDEKAVEAIVARYIAEHPEAIIDSVNAYAQKEQARAAEGAKVAAKDHLKALISAESGFVAGKAPDRAKVVVIEFFDYQCGFCKKATDTVLALTKSDPAVKVSFREFPILSEDSALAASFALAAREQGKYQEFHAALMKHSGRLDAVAIKAISDQVGLDAAKLNAARQNRRIPEIIEENMRIAADLRLEGTPGFIVATTDGSFIEVIDGWRPEQLEAAIKAAKKAG